MIGQALHLKISEGWWRLGNPGAEIFEPTPVPVRVRRIVSQAFSCDCQNPAEFYTNIRDCRGDILVLLSTIAVTHKVDCREIQQRKTRRIAAMSLPHDNAFD